MSTLISAYQLSKTFASKTLFENISFAIAEGEHIGLIGPNGAGKSTLLSIMGKKLNPDSGQISFSNNLRLAHLEQKTVLNEDLSIYDLLMEASGDPYESDNIQLALELISKLKLDSLSEGAEKIVSTLSGGWKKKVALAAELMKRPNLLLLDEPTNHLDLESILWLEDYLQKQNEISLLIVTHDRRFLQTTCNIIFEVNPMLPNGLLRTNGSYDAHIESKMILLDGQKRLEEKKRNTMLREKEWLARGPQARLTKQKARIERAYDLIDDVQNLETKNTKKSLDLDFGTTGKSPKRLIEAEQITKSYNGQPLFRDFSVLIRPKHRYGIIGSNGCGKSTLIKCLTGALPVDEGKVFTNDTIEISYFEQGKDQLDLTKSVLKIVCPEGDYVHFQDQPVYARSYLSRFYFRPQQMDMPASQLSGGELSRLIIAKLMLNKAHVLVLDEPTNDLDVETLESLSECISDFQGAVILVSHDRYFMDQNCDVIWSFDSNSNQIQTFADTFQWEDWHRRSIKESKKSDSKQSNNSATKKSGLTNKERIEFEKIESVIQNEEYELKKLQIKLALPEIQNNFEKLTELSANIAFSEEKIEKLMARWEELSLINQS